MELPAGASSDPQPVSWADALRRVLDDPSEPALVYQPIVDLARAQVAGYECLARFGPAMGVGPDEWFRQAHLHGCAAELEARVVAKVLHLGDQVPHPRFLSVNLSPALLTSPAVQEVFAAGGDLTGIVVELTEHVPYDVQGELGEALQRLRAAGALVAMDDAGSGYAGLTQLLTVRPQLVKLDRALVADLDRDAAKAALVGQFGAISGALDAWLLAEGIERVGELDSCLAMGIPLAQGYLLGRPGPTFAEIDDALAEHILLGGRRGGDTPLVGSLARSGCVVLEGADAPVAPGDLAVVDARGCPRGLLVEARSDGGPVRHVPVAHPMLVHLDDPIHVVATRAMTRLPAQRLDPVICVDDTGRFAGLVGIAQILSALAHSVETATEGTTA